METTPSSCPFCGQEIMEASSQFCGNCGKRLSQQIGPSAMTPPNRRNILKLGMIGAAGAMAMAAIGTTALITRRQQPLPVLLLPGQTVTSLNQTIHQKWAFPTRSAVDSSPTVVNGTLYIGSYDSLVYAINAHTGQQIWTFTASGPVGSSPTVDNGILYIGSNDGKLYALDTS